MLKLLWRSTGSVDSPKRWTWIMHDLRRRGRPRVALVGRSVAKQRKKYLNNMLT